MIAVTTHRIVKGIDHFRAGQLDPREVALIEYAGEIKVKSGLAERCRVTLKSGKVVYLISESSVKLGQQIKEAKRIK